jgi:hypothetical protein
MLFSKTTSSSNISRTQFLSFLNWQLLLPALVMVLMIAEPLAAANHKANSAPFSQSGSVLSDTQAVAFATITVYQAGNGNKPPRFLGQTEADANGAFTVRYKRPSGKNAILYLIADGPDIRNRLRGKRFLASPIRLATMLGEAPYPSNVIINERTTVATAYALAQFIEGRNIGGPNPGLKNAAATVRNLVNLVDGGIGDVLNTTPNGTETSALPTVNSLGNILSACVRDHSQCAELFNQATPPAARAPNNTLDAIINIAHNPGQNVDTLLGIAQDFPTYSPALPEDSFINPDSDNHVNALILALLYVSGGPVGPVIDGPGNIAIDSKGNAWVNNNYAFGEDPSKPVCGSTRLIKLSPTGGTPEGAPYGADDTIQDGIGGGGLYGAGFGITLDPDENVWVTNFGFQGQLLLDDSPRKACQNDAEVLATSVSKFLPSGEAESDDGDPSNDLAGGYPGPGSMKQPQGVKSDRHGNIWVAGCVGGTVTRFKRGNPDDANFMYVQDSPIVDAFDKAFDVAIDHRGHAWITANGTSNVVEINRNFNVVSNLTDGFDLPMGIASDSLGNMWVANAGLPNPPCPPALGEDPTNETGDDGGENKHAAVTLIDTTGKEPKEIGDDGGKNKRAAVTLIDTTGKEPKVIKFGKLEGNLDGLRWPWGIAVDGADNVWVANFAGQRIMHLCGAENATCPLGKSTGDPLSPDSGYFNNALQRITAVQIDPSGNVWMTNNWILDAFRFPENPGGKEVAVFIGLAKPVKTPLIGPPRTSMNRGLGQHDNNF